MCIDFKIDDKSAKIVQHWANSNLGLRYVQIIVFDSFAYVDEALKYINNKTQRDDWVLYLVGESEDNSGVLLTFMAPMPLPHEL